MPANPQVTDELNSIYAGLELLLAAVHADDPKRELLVRVGDLMRDTKSLTAALADHVVVTREPTWEMQIAGRDAIEFDEDDDVSLSTDDASDCYRAMISAAPLPQKEG